MFKMFWRDNKGATAIEYAMIAAFISIVIVGAVRQIGTNLNGLFFSKVAGNLS